jgi:hypothetical protein
MDLESSRLAALLKLQVQLKELVKAEKDSLKACKARAEVQRTWTRAKMTTANARWMTLAEYRDRVESRFAEMLKEIGY